MKTQGNKHNSNVDSSRKKTQDKGSKRWGERYLWAGVRRASLMRRHESRGLYKGRVREYLPVC